MRRRTFNAYSTKGDGASILFNFYTTPYSAYSFVENQTTILTMQVSGTFPNGSQFGSNNFPATAKIATLQDTSVAQFGEYGGWAGSLDAQSWEVTFQNEEAQLSGKVTLQSVSLLPPHTAPHRN